MAWDSTMRSKSEHKTNLEMAHIVYSRFACGDTKDGIMYSIGGLYVHPIVKHVSKAAYVQIKEANPKAVCDDGVWYAKLNVTDMKVTREHVIPISEMYKHLKKMWDHRKLDLEYILLEIMPRLEIALITVEENGKFKDAHLSRSMPKGWWETPDRDPFDRYREAGLGDDIWFKKFLTKATAKKERCSSQKAV